MSGNWQDKVFLTIDIILYIKHVELWLAVYASPE